MCVTEPPAAWRILYWKVSFSYVTVVSDQGCFVKGRSVVLEIDHSLVPSSPLGLPEPKCELLLLTSHSGLLHVHTLPAHRDPIFPSMEAQIKMPLISELASKKITNKLRTVDFNQFILSNRLVPAAPQSSFLPMERGNMIPDLR